jgi:hypothetical protein
MPEHLWLTVEPPRFFAEARCPRCELRRHVLGFDAALFFEKGVKRSWVPFAPPCPPPPPGPEDGSRREGDQAADEYIERALAGEF